MPLLIQESSELEELIRSEYTSEKSEAGSGFVTMESKIPKFRKHTMDLIWGRFSERFSKYRKLI